MKKLLLSLALLFCVGNAFGQTAEKLMAKYKAMPGAEYAETTEETRKSIEESREKGTGGLSKKDYNFLLKNFKKAEQIQLTLDDDQLEQLTKDIQALKGYETLSCRTTTRSQRRERTWFKIWSIRLSTPIIN